MLTRGDYCLIDPNIAAVPAPGTSATADPRDLLPKNELFRLKEDYVLKNINDRQSLEELNRRRIHLGVKPGQYPKLLSKMVSADMIEFRTLYNSIVENSIFGVWKIPGKSQRVIWGGERANMLFNPDARSVELPTPDIVSSLRLEQGDQLYLSSCDISQFFNRLKVPEFLIPYLGLPRVKASEVGIDQKGYVVPCLRCVPMGASFSVAWAQLVSVNSLRKMKLPVPDSPRNLIDAKIDRLQLPYIDDHNSIGTNKDEVNSRTNQIAISLANENLHVEPSKNIYADGITPSDSLGLSWWPSGHLTLRASSFVLLIRNTEEVLRRRKCTPKQMQKLIGSWTWPCLLRRPLLSIFDTVYGFSDRKSANVAQRIQSSSLNELHMLLDLCPFMCANLARPVATRIYATDASSLAAGVTYAECEDIDAFIQNVAETRVQKGWYTSLVSDSNPLDFEPVEGSDSIVDKSSDGLVSTKFKCAVTALKFRTAVSSRWKHKAHINSLELEAAVLGLRHACRTKRLHSSRVIFFLDNTSGVEAISKGRSSSHVLNSACRRIAAISLLCDIQVLGHWIPSKLNPADHPSRHARCRGNQPSAIRHRDSIKDSPNKLPTSGRKERKHH